MRIGTTSALALSFVLACGAAYADDKDKAKDHHGDHGGGDGHGDGHGDGNGHGHGDGHGNGHDDDHGAMDGGGQHGHGHDDADDDDGDDDAGTAIDPQRTPAQVEFRQKLLEREHALVKELTNHPGRSVTRVDRQQIGVHWRHVMRLLRIRELAERAKDAAAMKRVDELIEREDKKFRARLLGADAGTGGSK